MMLNFAGILESQNVRAGLRVVRRGESWNDIGDQARDDLAYRVRFGGYDPVSKRHLPPKYFDDFSTHPRIFELTAKGERSSAAGAYQCTATTYDWIAPKYGINSFRPYDQDCIAVALIHEAGALDDLIDGDLDRFVIKCGKWWASLPQSSLDDGGSKMTWQVVRETYKMFGGAPAGVTQKPAPIEDVSRPARPEDVERIEQQEERKMPLPFGFLISLIEEVVKTLPLVGTLLGKDFSKDQKKVDAGLAILDVVMRATGAKNEQEAVQKIAAEPAMRDVAQKAVEESWYTISSIVEYGGGVDAAWKRHNDPVSLPFWKTGAFYVTIALVAIAAAIVGSVLWGADWRPEDKSQVLMLGVSLLSGVMGYWLGSSIGSTKKTDLLANR